MDEADSVVFYMGTDTSGNQVILRATVDWSTGKPALGVAFAVLTETDIPAGKDLVRFDTAPEGNRIAFELHDEGAGSNQLLHIKDLAMNQTVFLTDGRDPNWSPDGSKIAFQEAAALSDILTINPDGTGRTVIANSNSFRKHSASGLVLPRWSPMSTHLVFLLAASPFGKADPAIYRVTAGGSQNTNLTKDLETRLKNLKPIAWR